MPQAPQQQPQPQPQHPVSPTATRKPRSSTPKPSKSTKSDAPSTKKTRTSVATQKRRRLVAAYDYDDLEPSHAPNSEPSQASPQSKPARFKRRANKPKRAKFPEGVIIHDTAPENYKSDAVIEDSDKVALEALQSLAKASEEPSKSSSKSAAHEKSVPDPVKNVEDPASDDDEDDNSSDDDNDDEDEVPLSHQQQKVFKDLISKDEKRPVLRPLQIPAPLRARLNMPQAPQQQPQPQPQHPVSPTATRKPRSSTPKPSKSTKSDAPSTKKTRTSVATQKRRRLVAAYDYDDLEPSHAPNSEPSQASPQSKPARFKRRANKPKRAKFPEGVIIHDTAPENYKSDAVIEDSDKVALEALQSLAKASEEPSKSSSKSAAHEKSVPDPVKNVEDPASDDDEDDNSSDDDNDDEDEVPLSHQQQKWSQNRGSQFQGNSKYGQEKALATSKGRHEEAGVCQ
ncbi:uncharacterized protein LOC135148043 [Daucus carota subsp. sativus]|uniref:uncharacterized protein LOC135148043 n=1 Tax=Daucus carota subsp. sativus TaxID=79200 RepID=UPI003082CB31